MSAHPLIERYGRWALVTGASSGIGLAYSRQLAALGFHCVLVSDDGPRLLQASADIASHCQVQAKPLVVDLAHEAAVPHLLAQVQHLDIGLVVSNAGYGRMGYFIQHPMADYLRMVRVNELASIALLHAYCSSRHAQRRRGAFIQVTSVNADLLHGVPFSAVYSAGKSMLKNITEAVHHEMRPLGLDVLNVAPGPTDTAFQDTAATRRLFFMETPEQVVQRSLQVLGRRAHITTNRVSRLLVLLHNYLPLPARFKTWCRAFFFSRILGKPENIRLPEQPES